MGKRGLSKVVAILFIIMVSIMAILKIAQIILEKKSTLRLI
jgi:hypothetical protein